ncbi:capsid assembly protein [Photorhabdus laumondii subsp. laumondii]|uniref:Capsid assembly protein n=1 Tax=Photorhabdus laumondii subsp. laumondii TaxID=141679 RepID=A0A6L9JNV5_PHOLM|nr:MULTISPECIES: head completion/stabilization protein [Photorhabdus]AXG42665.1 capsid assembly protein [Photorhabdus laumondii subsp. laumondii]MCC8384743.1 head completion/stabilization protein [Photorhabdus laumondii]MCC8413480.1 head completion/stabilization protein [Photorhabdus laumondii]NDK96474.1 capsid assembly protein [Photorhabdus laumondii subsp. laumondii]NDL17953.1 capsid assembly protein [Photorhabdus laumondii subsp. laumondii]
MNGLVASKGIAKSITESSGEENINDYNAVVMSCDFFPEINLSELRCAMRLNGRVTTERLTDKTIEAVAHINDQLENWRVVQEASGFSRLEDVQPAPRVNNVSVKVWRYRRAVYSVAKALLTEAYRDIDTTREGEKHAEALSTQIADLWRDARWAIRDVMGEERGLAELV